MPVMLDREGVATMPGPMTIVMLVYIESVVNTMSQMSRVTIESPTKSLPKHKTYIDVDNTITTALRWVI